VKRSNTDRLRLGSDLGSGRDTSDDRNDALGTPSLKVTPVQARQHPFHSGTPTREMGCPARKAVAYRVLLVNATEILGPPGLDQDLQRIEPLLVESVGG
jgi:hypothetical protein